MGPVKAGARGAIMGGAGRVKGGGLWVIPRSKRGAVRLLLIVLSLTPSLLPLTPVES